MLLLQEGSTVSWDPASCWDCGGQANWENLAALPLFVIALYVYWRCLRWLVAKRPRGIRYWLPTTMLAAGCLLAWAAGERENVLFEVITTICVFLNFPAMLGVLPVGLALAGVGADGWPLAVLMIAAAWATWYAVVRWMEVRREETGPLSLKLT